MALNFDAPKTDYSKLFGGGGQSNFGRQLGGLLGGLGNSALSDMPYSENALSQNLALIDEDERLLGGQYAMDEGYGGQGQFSRQLMQEGWQDTFSSPYASSELNDASMLPGTSANFGIGNVGINNNYNQPVDFSGGYQLNPNQLSQAWQNR